MTAASPTQRTLTRTDVEALAVTSFGRQTRVVDCGPLSGGGFAAVWWVRLDDGRTVVLKTSPPAGVPLLRYERDLLDAEVHYYRLVAEQAPEVLVPRVLAHDREPALLDGGWLFMTMLPGRSLSALAEAAGGSGAAGDAQVREAFGATMARLHRITGAQFGYDGERTSAGTWPDAFAALVEELLVDGEEWDLELAAAPSDIRAAVRRHRDALATVERPALVQFDGWDGNVLAAPDERGILRLTGMVDGERYLWGDPLMDFVSPALFRHLEDEPDHPFVRGYARATGSPVVFDDCARRRVALYRLHLYLLMNVELPSRGMTPESDPGRYAFLAGKLSTQVSNLA